MQPDRVLIHTSPDGTEWFKDAPPGLARIWVGDKIVWERGQK